MCRLILENIRQSSCQEVFGLEICGVTSSSEHLSRFFNAPRSTLSRLGVTWLYTGLQQENIKKSSYQKVSVRWATWEHWLNWSTGAVRFNDVYNIDGFDVLADARRFNIWYLAWSLIKQSPIDICRIDLKKKHSKYWTVAARSTNGACAIYKWIERSARGHRTVNGWNFMIFS